MMVTGRYALDLPAAEIARSPRHYRRAGTDAIVARRAERVGRAPAMMLIHGGGWVIGDLETHRAFVHRPGHRARPGVVVAIDYRLAPENSSPAAMQS